MEIGEKVVREVKQCAQSQEELKNELLNLNGQIALETQNLSMVKKEGNALMLQLLNKQETINSLKEQEEFLNYTRDSFNKALLWRSYFRKFIADMEPNNEQMNAMYQDMQNRYVTLIERYEQKPEYHQIIEAETKTRELTQVIGEKRNELMKLDTGREY